MVAREKLAYVQHRKGGLGQLGGRGRHLTLGSPPQTSERGALRLKGFWKPPPALRGLFVDSSLPSTSLSSSRLTLLELFLRGFFLVGLALAPPPRVARPLSWFSCACSIAASLASESSVSSLFSLLRCFFLGGCVETSISPPSTASPSSSRSRWPFAWRFGVGWGEAGSSLAAGSEDVRASNRASMRFFMAACVT